MLCFIRNKIEREIKEINTEDLLETYVLDFFLTCSMLIFPALCYMLNIVGQADKNTPPVPRRMMRPVLTIPWLRKAVAMAESVQASLQRVLDPVLGACGVLHFQSQPR